MTKKFFRSERTPGDENKYEFEKNVKCCFLAFSRRRGRVFADDQQYRGMSSWCKWRESMTRTTILSRIEAKSRKGLSLCLFLFLVGRKILMAIDPKILEGWGGGGEE